MARSMLSHLLDASLRSLVLAMPAVLALRLLGRRRTPEAAHRVWTAMLAGMLILFVLGPILPRLPLRVLPSRTPARVVLANPSGLRPAAVPAAPSSRPASPWPLAAISIYCAVALAGLAKLLAGSRMSRRLLRASPLVTDAEPTRLTAHLTGPTHGLLRESAAISVPVTLGSWRPCIVLPTCWRDWSRDKLEAVLTHEAAHVRRRDPLVALAAAWNRCLFWFHPLAWWIERRLALLAEQACDRACLRAAADRESYARLLVEMADSLQAAGGRLNWRALAIAGPSHLKRRIEAILEVPLEPPRRLKPAAVVALAACALPLLFAAAALRLEPQPPLAQLILPPPAAPAPPLSFVVHARQLPAPTRAERDLYAAVSRETDPHRRLALLEMYRAKYPHSRENWLQLTLNTYSQLNDIPNLLAALNQMGRQEFIRTLKINPPQSEGDGTPKVSKALFYYARAATYEGPGSLPPEGRQQLDDYLRKTYNSIYGQNEVGLDELKRLAKSYPFPPQYFQIALLPPPSRTFDASLATERSSIHIRNQCPYGMRIDCNGPERKRAWIEPGQDSHLEVAPGTYQIHVADASGVSSFTGPGRFDPQFDYAYTLALRRD